MARSRAFDKEAVLEKAVRLFRCRGYEAASVQEITEATGLSRSSLYDTFGEKNALYMAALDHYISQREKVAFEALHAPGSKKAAIRAAFDWIIEEVIGNPEAGCFAVNAATELGSCDEGVQEAISRSVARTVAALADAVRAGQQQGEISPAKDSRAIAEFLVN
ncbi:MAG: TetR/AcrR family transcriptional regulator, partial [Fibrella sp.]|nr:TetR/AcrR family transcriptional regulator [Armatimonadota bacterium]